MLRPVPHAMNAHLTVTAIVSPPICSYFEPLLVAGACEAAAGQDASRLGETGPAGFNISGESLMLGGWKQGTEQGCIVTAPFLLHAIQTVLYCTAVGGHGGCRVHVIWNMPSFPVLEAVSC